MLTRWRELSRREAIVAVQVIVAEDAATAAEATEALLAAAEGRTLVLATHDPVLAARMDRVVCLP